MSLDSNTFSNWLKSEEVTAEDDVEYFVLTSDYCFYTAFFNPLGFEGWKDVGTDRHLEVVLYHELPDAGKLLNTFR